MTNFVSAAVSWEESAVQINGGAAPLHGTLTRPKVTTTADAVLIIQGSGPTDRNGNSPGLTNNALQLLAHHLGDAGIISLRVDKRGIAESRGAVTNESDLRFNNYIIDTEHWFDFLKSQDHVRRVFLIGHSEGALIVTIAAQRKSASGVILLNGAGRPASTLILEQLNRQDPNGKTVTEAKRILNILAQDETTTDVLENLQSLFRPSVQPYLASWIKYDPATELARLSVPVLILQGGRDQQVSRIDAERLAGKNEAAELIFIDDMNHVLKSTPDDITANMNLYSDPDAPLADRLVPEILKFIQAK